MTILKQTGLPRIEKRTGQITDLKFKDYLFVDFSKLKDEKDALNTLETRLTGMLTTARHNHLPQIQVKYPFNWEKFKQKLESYDFMEGLYFIEKKVIKNTIVQSEDTVEIKDIYIIEHQLALQQKLHHDLNPMFFSRLKDFDIKHYLQEIQTMIEQNKAIAYYVRDHQKILGFIVIENNRNKYYICELFVEGKHRGLGVGTKLMNAADRYVSAHKVKTVYTSLAVQNKNALIFYKKSKYLETSTLSYYLLKKPV
jgi:ribosomal protein S18 acetylase RimI-like enzyme